MPSSCTARLTVPAPHLATLSRARHGHRRLIRGRGHRIQDRIGAPSRSKIKTISGSRSKDHRSPAD
eukprot:10469521-Alexandrium_andersonii.AAC.1